VDETESKNGDAQKNQQDDLADLVFIDGDGFVAPEAPAAVVQGFLVHSCVQYQDRGKQEQRDKTGDDHRLAN
jgi:hypothetical protein